MQSHEHHTPQSNGHKTFLDVESLDSFNYTDPLDDEMAGTTKDDRLYELLERRFEDDRREADKRHAEMIAAFSGSNARKPPAWASFALSLVALLGVGINIGIYINRSQQLEQATVQLREDYNRVNSRFEKMRDLYMVQFGADPEDPNTKVNVKKGR